jgi:hypothetical protein
MDFKQLQYHASDCQIAADEMAYNLLQQNEIFKSISVFQSRCSFNLFWLYQISPEIFIHLETIKFLSKHINKFKRKIGIKEMVKYDLIITRNEINNFTDFKNLSKVID